jgi:hypothetical protein
MIEKKLVHLKLIIVCEANYATQKYYISVKGIYEFGSFPFFVY